jgi:uncharacterized membrane protein
VRPLDKNGQLLILAILAFLGGTGQSGAPLGAILAAPFVFFLPGHIVLHLAGLKKADGFEHALFSFGLSVAMVMAAGLLLHSIGCMTRMGWAIVLIGLPAAICIAFRKYPALTIENTGPLTLRAAPRKDVALLGLAALLSISAFTFDHYECEAHAEFSFTELWMTAPNPAKPNALSIGINNKEGKPAAYDIELMVNGAAAASWRKIDLQPGETWTSEFNAGFRPGRTERVEVWLFRDHDHSLVYRRVWLDLSPV